MHILMIVLGAIAFIGGLIWRLQAASQAGAKVADMAQTVKPAAKACLPT